MLVHQLLEVTSDTQELDHDDTDPDGDDVQVALLLQQYEQVKNQVLDDKTLGQEITTST